MKTFLTTLIFIVLILAALFLVGTVEAQTTQPATQPTRPKILIGFDAQPIGNMDKVKAMGANALHRYESGPAKNTTLATWISEADKRGLYSIIQGSAADAQGVDLATLPKTVVAVSHDDEPDLNRWPYKGDDAAKAIAKTWLYSPDDAPHTSIQGYTRPEILKERRDRWKKKTQLPIIVNFAGPSINSGWYKPDLAWHQGYIKASDLQGFDLYPKNANGDGGHLYWPANVMDKINAAGGKCADAYIECAFGGGEFKRGPTAAEQSVLTWSLVGHGARGLWYFPQRVNPPFSYWALTPENEAAAKADIANILKYADIIDGGKLKVAQSPKVQNSNYTAPGGVLVWPNDEAYEWELNGDKLSVFVNFADPQPPRVVFIPKTGPPIAKPESERPTTTQPTIADVNDKVDQLRREVDLIKASMKAGSGN